MALLFVQSYVTSNPMSAEPDSESSEISSNESGDGNPIEEFDDEKIQNLNTDELEIMFTRLEIDQLAHMAAVDDRFANVAKKELAKRCPDFQLQIIWAHIGQDPKFSVKNSVKWLSVNEYKLGLKLLKYFGELFPVLGIHNNNFEPERAAVINRYANKYVSQYVTQFKLNVIDGTLEQYTNPFTAVKQVESIIKAETFGDVLPWSRLFPNVEKLQLTLPLEGKFGFIDCELPNLQELTVVFDDESNGTRWQRNEQIEGLIRKNRQIRYLKTDFCPKDYIKVINHLLPELETLILYKMHILNEEGVHFETVKRFVLLSNHPVGIDKLSFKSIESLRCHYSPKLFDSWLAFLKNHPNLFRLHLVEDTSSDQSIQLEELTSVLPNLVEVTMQYTNYISREAISTFIKTHDKLMKFSFFSRSFEAPDFDILRERFSDDWEIDRSHVSRPGLLFVRKINE